MSGIWLFSSGVPSGPDVAGATCGRGVLTQRRPWTCRVICRLSADLGGRPSVGGQGIFPRHVDSDATEPPVAKLEEVAVGLVCQAAVMMRVDDGEPRRDAALAGVRNIDEILMLDRRVAAPQPQEHALDLLAPWSLTP